MGARHEVTRDVWIIAATSQDLDELVRQGRFRSDLRGRLRGAHLRLPRLVDRPEDQEPALDTELTILSEREKRTFSMTSEARALWLFFVSSPEAIWPENFRSHGYAVELLTGHAVDGVIDVEAVELETAALRDEWARQGGTDGLESVVSREQLRRMGRTDRIVLAETVRSCRRMESQTEVSRYLYASEESPKPDPSRLRRYLEKFGLTFEGLRQR